MAAATILLIEDDREIRQLVGDLLEREDYRVLAAGDGRQANRFVAQSPPDLVVLDLMLPGEDGLSICRRLRAQGNVPILMVTAKGDPVDRVVGLELGADDYLVKPFDPRELLARVRALLRRAAGLPTDPRRRRFLFAGLEIDLDSRRLAVAGGERVALTSAEFDLLACLVERPRRVLTRDQLLDWTRGRTADPFDRTIDVTVSRLRRKLDQAVPGGAELVETVRNGGYLLAAEIGEG
ncbi:response regulator [Stella sp.]|uniref:response regulator n=1 Tax=Stella sp. TaxID=2912054 RepID=UPI0035B08AB1